MRQQSWGCVMVAVGTWNLENLYRPGGQFGPKTQEAYEAKLAALAATITRLSPDVLAVQEIGQSDGGDRGADGGGGVRNPRCADAAVGVDPVQAAPWRRRPGGGADDPESLPALYFAELRSSRCR